VGLIDFKALEDLARSLEEAPKKADERRAVDEVLDRYNAVKTDAEEWHNYVKRCRSLALLESKDKDNIYDITLSKPHNVVTFSKGVLLTADYLPEARAIIESEQSRPFQSAYEKFSVSLWDDDEERQAFPVRDDYITNLLVDGSAWCQIYIDPDHAPPTILLPEWADQPVTMEVVDTLQVYPQLSNMHKRMFDYIITYHKESLYDLRKQWAEKDWDQYLLPRDDYGQEITEREFMIDVYNYHGYDLEDNVVQTICTDKLLLADEVLWSAKVFPDLPWVVDGCYSFRSADDGETAGSRLIARFQSILHPIDDDITTAQHLLSADMRAIDLYGNMPPVVITKAGREVQVDADWGNVVKLQDGESIGFPSWPGNPPDSSRMLGFVMADSQEASFSSAAMGFAGSSASGYHVALTTESSRTRLYLPGRAMARAMSRSGRMAAHLLKSFFPETKFRFFGQRIGDTTEVGTFAGYMADGLKLTFNVKLTMPGDEVKKAAIATQHRALGLPLVTILEDDLDYKQPDDILRKIDEEKARQHPLVQLIALMETLKLTNSPYLPIIMEAFKQQAQGQAQGAQGNSGSNPNPEFRPPGQGPMTGAMGQDVLPLAEQGFGQVPGAVPQSSPAF
jgi:hypothetical protein